MVAYACLHVTVLQSAGVVGLLCLQPILCSALGCADYFYVCASYLYSGVRQVTRCLPYTKRADGSEAKNVPAVLRLCTDRLREVTA